MAKKKDRRFDYFDAFEKQAEIALKEAELLINVIDNYTSSDAVGDILKKAHDIENEGDQISHEIFTAIATDFITPIEREDIMALTQYLDDILDYIEDVIQRFYMYDINEMHDKALEFAKIMKKSCKALCRAMEDFRNFKKSKKFKELIIDVNTFEEEGDALYMEIIRNLHKNKKDDPLYVMTWSQLYMRMEKCTDACEHAADTMRSIVLKNS